MIRTTLILKNGYRFTGQIVEETETTLIINEVKLGRTEIDKGSISARSDQEAEP